MMTNTTALPRMEPGRRDSALSLALRFALCEHACCKLNKAPPLRP
ncbi:MAG TPA: hypothetical protein PKN45_04555 [Candidatus Limiplasma sp.]|nr:hypothetical protein [Candidatus Limiplasma sp.]